MYPRIIALCLLPFFAHGQRINRKEVREFMNQYLTEISPRNGDSTEPVIYMKRTPNMRSVLSNCCVTTKDTVEDLFVIEPNFTAADSTEITKSLKYAGNYRFSRRDWRNGRLKTFKHIEKYFKRQYANEWRFTYILKSTNTQYHFWSVSTPIFYGNYTKALFYRHYRCGGNCGSGGLYIYERVNGMWKVEKGLTMEM